MDGATSLDDGSQTSLQPPTSHNNKESSASTQQASNVQNATSTVNNSSSSLERANNITGSAGGDNNHRSSDKERERSTNGPHSNSNKDADFEPTRLLEASMTTDHGNDNSQHDMPTTGPENSLIPEGLDIKPIITLEEGGATPAGAIVPASGASSLPTGTDAALSSLFPTGTGATALPGTSYQASPQSHDTPSLIEMPVVDIHAEYPDDMIGLYLMKTFSHSMMACIIAKYVDTGAFAKVTFWTTCVPTRGKGRTYATYVLHHSNCNITFGDINRLVKGARLEFELN